MEWDAEERDGGEEKGGEGEEEKWKWRVEKREGGGDGKWKGNTRKWGEEKNGDQVRGGILENKGFWFLLWRKGNLSTAGESKVFRPLSVSIPPSFLHGALFNHIEHKLSEELFFS